MSNDDWCRVDCKPVVPVGSTGISFDGSCPLGFDFSLSGFIHIGEYDHDEYEDKNKDQPMLIGDTSGETDNWCVYRPSVVLVKPCRVSMSPFKARFYIRTADSGSEGNVAYARISIYVGTRGTPRMTLYNGLCTFQVNREGFIEVPGIDRFAVNTGENVFVLVTCFAPRPDNIYNDDDHTNIVGIDMNVRLVVDD